jgi:hypothetical protein
MEEQAGWTIPFNQGRQRLRCRPLSRTVNRADRQVIQTVEYTVINMDDYDTVVRRSVEFYTYHYHWFDDWEMEAAAARARLILRQTLTGFGETGDGGPKTMYVLEQAVP